MYAVIFRATVARLDDQYHATARRLRRLAMERYGCLDFVAFSEGDRELAVSWWESEAQIRAWKADPEHRAAQALGRERWYRDYRVEVVEVKRDYRFGPEPPGE